MPGIYWWRLNQDQTVTISISRIWALFLKSLMINLSSHFWAVSGTGQAFQMVLVIKKPPANTGDIRNWGSIPGSGRSPAGGHSNPHRSSYLENPMDRGAWRATVHGDTKSQTQLSACQQKQEQVSDDSLRAAPSKRTQWSEGRQAGMTTVWNAARWTFP